MSKIQKVMNKLPSIIRPFDGTQPFAGEKVKKQNLYFGCNWQDQPTIVLRWCEKGRGWGEYVFYVEEGKLKCKSECDDRETVKRMLCMMVDQAEFTELSIYSKDQKEPVWQQSKSKVSSSSKRKSTMKKQPKSRKGS